MQPLGVHLVRTEETIAEVDALADLLGGRTGVAPLLDDLNRQGRAAYPWGRAVTRAFTWDAEDRRTPRWYPQGITTSADADDSERVAGRAVVVVAWYLKDGHGQNQGSRLTFVDLATLRYRHVLLVRSILRAGRLTLAPLKVHAGGIVWRGPYLHVAATSRGFVTCRVDDLMRIRDRAGYRGYRYVLPARFAYQAYADAGHERMKYSFLSLDRSAHPPALVAGEYGRGPAAARLVRYSLDPETSLLDGDADGICRPASLDAGGVSSMQGACVARGRYHVTVSHGPHVPGSVYVGHPGAWRPARLALPMGPEDISYWPSADLLWSLTEHPGRRWVVAMPRSYFD